ncbi:hypothetical protein CERSUDRAFT_75815 [Gelatoporia subvermispora B]|uniref:DUF6533 domain-containing protein n=1 Tax=Ceriporiopsis subvermispora (strain B) TaxID=914234 RepID=M2R753_CERS8|nr:hypothetical protein CERSUDRAFT_75815 [Gelatoporia subvermispora B]
MSDEDTQDIVAGLVGYLQPAWVGSCCNVAVASLVIYDYATTLEREVELMWRRKLTSVTMLFYLNRWVTVIWVAHKLLISNLLSPPADIRSHIFHSCVALSELGNALNIMLLLLWAGSLMIPPAPTTVFSGIRIYAVSSGTWILSAIVAFLSLVPVATNSYYYFATQSYAIDEYFVIGTWCDYFTVLDEATTLK